MNCFLAVPSLYSVLIDQLKESTGIALRTVILAGETCPSDLAIQHNHERFLAAIEHPDQPVGDGWETSPLPIEEVKQVVYQFVQPTFAQAA